MHERWLAVTLSFAVLAIPLDLRAAPPSRAKRLLLKAQAVVRSARETVTKWATRPLTRRGKVQLNLKRSQVARSTSHFDELAARERAGFPGADRTSAQPPRPLDGPAAVPHNYVIASESTQPSILFDRADPVLKRELLRKAGRLRMNSHLKPWAIINRLQTLIRDKVPHAGNEISVHKNPNAYTLFNEKRMDVDGVARLGDYLRVGKAVCREQAFLTHVALLTAGFEARLVTGLLDSDHGPVGGHVWNEAKIDGRWQIVDTTNRDFNGSDPVQAAGGGVHGYYFRPAKQQYRILPQADFLKARALSKLLEREGRSD